MLSCYFSCPMNIIIVITIAMNIIIGSGTHVVFVTLDVFNAHPI